MSVATRIPSANFHVWKPCNMKCGFCFAAFHDIGQDRLPAGHLGREDCIAVVERLAEGGFEKINFAGGEPTLCPWLRDLIRRAKERGLTTSVVSNGSRITRAWLAGLDGSLDWVALSIDSIDPDRLRKLGRSTSSGPLSAADYLGIVGVLREQGIRLKINTVVNRHNCEEDLTDFIIQARPERWKLLQVLPVSGQNDRTVAGYTVSREQFDRYVQRNRKVEAEGIVVVPESNDLMTGSYVMVDPAGRFLRQRGRSSHLQPPYPQRRS